jgi:hypothetical protein
MKINIYYKKEKLTISSDTKIIKIRDLLKYLKKELKINENDNLILCSERRVYNKTDTLKPENLKEEFLLVANKQNELDELEEAVCCDHNNIEKLIKEITGATEVMKANKSHRNGFRDSFGIRRLNISNLSNIMSPFDSIFNGFLSRGNFDGDDSELEMSSDDRPPIFVNRAPTSAPEISQDSVNTLVEMGFEEPRARTALRVARGNLSRATELLLNSDTLLDEAEESNQNNNNSEEAQRQNILNRRRFPSTLLNFLARRRPPDSDLEGIYIH